MGQAITFPILSTIQARDRVHADSGLQLDTANKYYHSLYSIFKFDW